MGATGSSLSELPDNPYLKRLCGTEPVNSMDPYWNQLLSFSFLIPVNSCDARILEESTAAICRNFAINNCHTGNFRALIRNFLIRASELRASAQCEDNIFIWQMYNALFIIRNLCKYLVLNKFVNIFIWQTYNALFIIRSLCKYFVEHLSEELLLQQFDCKPPGKAEVVGSGSVSSESEDHEDDEEVGALAEELMAALVELLIDVPIMRFTYALHLEALNMLLLLLSIQMFQPLPAAQFRLYKFMMTGKCAIHAPLLVKALLWNYINQEKCPTELYKGSGEGGSFFYNVTAKVASSLWTVMTLGLGGASKPEKSEEDFQETLLANQSLLFLLVLTNHCTAERGFTNPYREALFAFADSEDSSGNTNPTRAVATFKIDLGKLYQTLCLTLRDDQTTLLLYLLIHRNAHMKAYILSRTNIDALVLPLLRILYQAQEKNSHHIYMALIILLIFSEDEVFNKSIHEIHLKNVMWFKERPLPEITLGGLLILVVIRTIQFNMSRMRDKYLHTNCLAALANMSAHFSNLHQFVAQKIVNLFSQLVKKQARLVEQIRETAVAGGEDPVREAEAKEQQQTFVEDLGVLEEVMRMVLEIINSCLAASLHHNPNLVYTLLYQRELFTQLRSHPTFQDIIPNIDTVLHFFSARLEQKGHSLSPQEVLEVITQASKEFRRDKLQKFPDLKFKYVEEESPEEFFIPYIWSLVYHSSNLYFNASRIVLFSLSTPEG